MYVVHEESPVLSESNAKMVYTELVCTLYPKSIGVGI